jgi:hypothetical protein
MKFAVMRGNKTLAEHPTISKWQELGFTSKEAATKAVLIADSTTNKATQAKLLSSQYTPSSTNSPVKALTSFALDDSEEDSTLLASHSMTENLQLFTIIPVLTSWTSHKPLPLRVTRRFLHFLLPVDTSKDKNLHLNVLVDSAGGASLGEYLEHKTFAQEHPDSVHQFIDLSNNDEYALLAINGINSSSPATPIKAVIIYQLPFLANGLPAMLSLGLADGLPASTLVSLPFLDATQSVIDLANKFICCNAFGEVWPFTLKEISVNDPSNFTHVPMNGSILSTMVITSLS